MLFRSIYPSLESFENNSERDGHFGTKRWHYYDSWNFTAIGGDNIASDTASSNPRGTGGMIRFDPKDLSNFASNRHLFFERLFNYRRDDDNLQFPYEPLRTAGTASEIDTPEERDATQDSYQVQMFTSLNLDELDPSSPDDEASFDHTNYSNVNYKVFFKLWITRDEKRDGYAGNLQTNPGVVTDSFIPGVKLKSFAGADIVANTDTGVAWDLHPIWSISRLTPTNNSFWRENYLKDFMDTDAKDGRSLTSGQDQRLGVLQFPVPYLAYQRADKDYWVDSIRGTSAVSSPSGDDGLPLDHPHYTRFTLWSLGTVREINQDNFGRTVPESEQQIDHFEVVTRALYKLVFYMDTRAVEVNDEDQLTQGQDNQFLSTLGCDGNQKNMNNTTAFNAIYIPEIGRAHV